MRKISPARSKQALVGIPAARFFGYANMYVKLFTAGNSLLPLLVHTTSYPHGDNTLFLPYDTEECASPKKKVGGAGRTRNCCMLLLHESWLDYLRPAGRPAAPNQSQKAQTKTHGSAHACIKRREKRAEKKRTLCMCLCASSLFGCCPVPTMNRAKHSGRFSIQTSASENAPVSVHVMRLSLIILDSP